MTSNDSNRRWYGSTLNGLYDPLCTNRTPRPGWQNDVIQFASGIKAVVLQDGTYALVDDADYDLMRARGWVARWTTRKVTGNNWYPSINHGDAIRPIARIILDARKGERVSYRNGDQLDLTRSNLVLKAKGGIEICAAKRSCPIAPTLGKDESARSVERVSFAVGRATRNDRERVAYQARATAQLSMAGRS